MFFPFHWPWVLHMTCKLLPTNYGLLTRNLLSYCVWLQITFCSCVNETRFSPSCDRSYMKMAAILLLNSVSGKYHDLSVSHRSIIICLSHLLATDKSGYFSQPRPIIILLIFSSRKAFISNDRVCQTCAQVMELVSIETSCNVALVDWYPKFDFINWADHWFDICNITLNLGDITSREMTFEWLDRKHSQLSIMIITLFALMTDTNTATQWRK